MAVNIEKILKDKRTELEEQVSAYNAAVKKNNFTAMAKAEADGVHRCENNAGFQPHYERGKSS